MILSPIPTGTGQGHREQWAAVVHYLERMRWCAANAEADPGYCEPLRIPLRILSGPRGHPALGAGEVLCSQHQGTDTSSQCAAHTGSARTGPRCKAWPLTGTPFCRAHAPTPAPAVYVTEAVAKSPRPEPTIRDMRRFVEQAALGEIAHLLSLVAARVGRVAPVRG
jgi:hypothetical protein